MKLLLKLLVGLIGLAGLAVIVALLSVDSLARTAMESSIRAQTGMEAQVGKVNVGLIRPTLRVENFTLYNSAEFGGSPMLTLPEIFLEYDRDAASRQQLHLRLLRVNLSEVNIVEDALGRTNLTAFPGWLEKFQIPKGRVPEGAVQFQGIDTLNLSFGKVRVTSLRDPSRNTEIAIGLQNEIVRNVRSETNLYFLLAKIAMRAGNELFDRAPAGAAAAPAPRPARGNSPAPSTAPRR